VDSSNLNLIQCNKICNHLMYEFAPIIMHYTHNYTYTLSFTFSVSIKMKFVYVIAIWYV
jgi:hypothetical protein